MKKEEYFLAALRHGEACRRAWVMGAFSLIVESPDAWKAEPYPYRIVQMTTGFYFVDPNNENQLSPIEGGVVGKPLFAFKDRIQIKKNDLANVNSSIDTTYGNCLVNAMVLIYPFGNKVSFLTGKLNAGKIEDEIILPRLRDTPAEGTRPTMAANAAGLDTSGKGPADEPIYVDEYLKFGDAMFALAGFAQLCVPAASEKTMQAAPDIDKLRDKLLAENVGREHDPAVIAKIDAELVAFDKEYLKGDVAEGFLINKKSWDIRKKQYGMHGAEVGLGDKVEVDLIRNSLSEGWDINKFPTMNNSLRAGSYNRGALTMLGGAANKELSRASSNLFVRERDCGTFLGMPIDVDGNNYKSLISMYVVGTKDPIPVRTEEEAKTYIGKKVLRRSPMFCKLRLTDYCECCVGDRLAMNPAALSVAVTEFGAAFLELFMGAAHLKPLSVAKLDWKRRIT